MNANTSISSENLKLRLEEIPRPVFDKGMGGGEVDVTTGGDMI